MKTQETLKKIWTKPFVQTLNIKKDTFSGTLGNPEGTSNSRSKKAGPPIR